MYLQSNCYRYEHHRCKGSKGCECWCHPKGELEGKTPKFLEFSGGENHRIE